MFIKRFEDEKARALKGAIIIITTCEKKGKREWESMSNDQLLAPTEPEVQGADPCGQLLWAAYTYVPGSEAAVPKVWDGEHHGGCRADSTTQHQIMKEGSHSLYFLFESYLWHLRGQGQIHASQVCDISPRAHFPSWQRER